MLVNPEQTYKHYKGGIYFILHQKVRNTETGEDLVVYTDGKQIFARPYEMFHEFAEDGVKRFNKISLSSNT